MWSRTTAAATLAALTLSSPVLAQDFVRADCRDYASAGPALYDSPEHQRWYKRFWTGDCDHLSFCFPGSPNWNDIVARLVTRGGPSQRAVLLPKACRLGRLIGLEWSREKKIRRIDTNDLKVFGTMMEASGDPLRGVERVEASAQTKLKR